MTTTIQTAPTNDADDINHNDHSAGLHTDNSIPVFNPDDIYRVECPMTSEAICTATLAHPGDPTVLDTDNLVHRLVVTTAGSVADTVTCTWDYPDEDTEVIVADLEAHVVAPDTVNSLTDPSNYDGDSRDLAVHITTTLDPELTERWLIVDAMTITEHWRGVGLLTTLLTRLADLTNTTQIILVAAPLSTGLPQHPDVFTRIQDHYTTLGFSFVDDVPEFYPADPEQLARVMTAQVDTLR